jgi:Zn finger protein HypA/HybF involved in hydrogenase expression
MKRKTRLILARLNGDRYADKFWCQRCQRYWIKTHKEVHDFEEARCPRCHKSWIPYGIFKEGFEI